VNAGRPALVTLRLVLASANNNAVDTPGGQGVEIPAAGKTPAAATAPTGPG